MGTTALTPEEEGVGRAAGLWLGGKDCALLMPSSGAGNNAKCACLNGSDDLKSSDGDVGTDTKAFGNHDGAVDASLSRRNIWMVRETPSCSEVRGLVPMIVSSGATSNPVTGEMRSAPSTST
jgi:hypothetical protein